MIGMYAKYWKKIQLNAEYLIVLNFTWHIKERFYIVLYNERPNIEFKFYWNF